MIETAQRTRPITGQDWKRIEEKLKSFYSPVELHCDGYKITLVLDRISVFQNAIYLYIDGKIKAEWLKDCEERRRFYRAETKSVLTAKDIRELKKISRSKKYLQHMKERSSYKVYHWHWTSFRALKCHLVKNNKSIEIVIEDNEKEGE